MDVLGGLFRVFLEGSGDEMNIFLFEDVSKLDKKYSFNCDKM